MGSIRKIVFIACLVGIISFAIPRFSISYHEILVNLPYAQEIGAFVHKSLLDLTSQSLSAELKSTRKKFKERIFKIDDLKLYDGKPNSKGLYLGILGQVFDVKKGKKHYGPGGGYDFFAGKDGTRAFVSGDFTEDGLIDDVTGLSTLDLIGIDEWLQFYKKDYKYVGKLVGKYYDKDGNPTKYNIKVQGWIAEAYKHKEDENIEKKTFPPCNSEYYPETGTRVWCTNRSGGVTRNWVGVPRKFYSPGKRKPRCACIKDFGPPSHDPTRVDHNNKGDLELQNIAEYPGCPPNEYSCQVPKNAA